VSLSQDRTIPNTPGKVCGMVELDAQGFEKIDPKDLK
jgi:hypothetical protein